MAREMPGEGAHQMFVPGPVAGLEILQPLKLNAHEDTVFLLVDPLNLSPDNSGIPFPGEYVLEGDLNWLLCESGWRKQLGILSC